MDAFTGLFTAIMGILTDFMVRLLFFLLIFQTLGFFWFVYVILRFGLLRRDEPERKGIYVMTEWINPNLPEPKITGNRGADAEVEIKANGAVLKFSFDSWDEAQSFIDAYANAYSVEGSWQGLIRAKHTNAP